MNHPDKHIKELIARFLDRTASEADLSELKAWLGENEINKKYFDEINEAFQANTILGNFNPEKVDSAWQKFSERMGEDIGKPAARMISRTYYNFLRIAASISILLLASFGLWKYLQHDSTDSSRKVIVYNPQGRNTHIMLPDSTSVWLNTNSTLEYNSDFEKGKREVVLKGEAFFDVRKKQRQNFIVKTDHISIQVKGTRFNVRAYDGQDENTTLEEGKVELTVHGAKKKYNMTPGDQITVTNKQHKVTMKKVDPSDFSAWKEDKLVFDNALLADIIVKLENRFKVKIIVSETIAQRERLTMTITNETIEEILELIQLSSHLNYKKEKDRIIIYE
ncbi:MAG: FecR family protein [Bacteroidota bacterium]